MESGLAGRAGKEGGSTWREGRRERERTKGGKVIKDGCEVSGEGNGRRGSLTMKEKKRSLVSDTAIHRLCSPSPVLKTGY